MGLVGRRSIQKETAAQEKAAQAVVAKAKAMAIALQTIGKFVIKKKVGESHQIFGRWAILRARMLGQKAIKGVGGADPVALVRV